MMKGKGGREKVGFFLSLFQTSAFAEEEKGWREGEREKYVFSPFSPAAPLSKSGPIFHVSAFPLCCEGGEGINKAPPGAATVSTALARSPVGGGKSPSIISRARNDGARRREEKGEEAEKKTRFGTASGGAPFICPRSGTDSFFSE